MKAVEIRDSIYWVGAIDWAVRDFHGYVTPRGTSYNNYLLLDDEIAQVRDNIQVRPRRRLA